MSKPVTVFGPKDPCVDGAISTVSHARGWTRGLSPFLLGPVKLWGGHKSRNMENGWQYSKVYSRHLDRGGNVTPEWLEWAKSGWASTRAERYPMGKGAKPEFVYWNHERLPYVESRKRVYIPLYASAVYGTDAFFRLRSLYRASKKSIVLWDFDAYDHRALGMSWRDVMNHPTKRCGHGFVLAMMLEGYLNERGQLA